MNPKTGFTIGYIGVIILAVLISSSVVSSRTMHSGSDTETRSEEEVVHPLTLEDHSQSRHKRNVDCPDLECRSLCPWTWVHDSQDGREPRSIFKAQCLNQSCDFDFDGLGQRTKRKLQLLTECDLVYTDIKVWQDEYPAWIRWPIACACSRARSRTMLRLGDGIVMSEFNRHRPSNTGSF